MKPRRKILATALGGALAVVSGQGDAPIGQARMQANDAGRARRRLSGHRNLLRHRGDYGNDAPGGSTERTDARALETHDEKRLRKQHKKEARDAADVESAQQAHEEKRDKKQRNKELKLEAAAMLHDEDDEDHGCICDNGGSHSKVVSTDVVMNDEEGESATPLFGSRLNNEVNTMISKLYETGSHRKLARGETDKSEKDDDDHPTPKSKSGKKSKKSPKRTKSSKSKGSKSCVCSPTHAPSTSPTVKPTNKGDYSTSFEGGPPFPEDYPGWSGDDMSDEQWGLSQERARTGDWSIKAPAFVPENFAQGSTISYTTGPDSGAGIFRMWYDFDGVPSREEATVFLDGIAWDTLLVTSSFEQYSLSMESGSHTVMIQYLHYPGLERRLQDEPQGGAFFVDDVSYEVLDTVVSIKVTFVFCVQSSHIGDTSTSWQIPTLSPTESPSEVPTLVRFP